MEGTKMDEMLEEMAIEERNEWLDQVAQEMADEARAEERAWAAMGW